MGQARDWWRLQLRDLVRPSPPIMPLVCNNKPQKKESRERKKKGGQGSADAVRDGFKHKFAETRTEHMFLFCQPGTPRTKRESLCLRTAYAALVFGEGPHLRRYLFTMVNSPASTRRLYMLLPHEVERRGNVRIERIKGVFICFGHFFKKTRIKARRADAWGLRKATTGQATAIVSGESKIKIS